MKKSVFVVTAFLFGYALLALAQTMPASGAAVPEKTALPAMTRDSRCGQILTTCFVDGHPMRMMLDTGATHTVLHSDSVEKLKNPRWLDTSRITFKGNSKQRPKILIAPLEVGPGTFPRHPVIVVSLAAVRSMMEEKIDGIIGMDILGALPFTFNLQKKEYGWGVPATNSLIPIPGKFDANGRLFVHVLSGEKSFPLLLDTGSSSTRIRAEDWAPGIAGQISAKIGNIDTAQQEKIRQGCPGILEIAPDIRLKKISPLLCDSGDLTMLGMDALEDSILVHIPTKKSRFGAFFFAR
ncbi:MAG: clan AA aspartic protease [Opitutales bacterium]|nr:clan AA aspartic protease [Opitutales bacterium]